MPDMTPFYREEDLFPREFTTAHARPWGVLFHNANNPDSYDSNHALIFRNRVDDLPAVLAEIADFYRSRGLRAIIYQSILDDGWFGEIADVLKGQSVPRWVQIWADAAEPKSIAEIGEQGLYEQWLADAEADAE